MNLSPFVHLCFDWLLIANDVCQEYSPTIDAIPYLDQSTGFCINKSRYYVQLLSIKSTFSLHIYRLQF